MTQVSYDERAITIDGKRTILLGGAIHYPRSTPEMWPVMMERSREAGLNTIETYVFWNFHERKRGVYDFSDRLDLMRYCRMAQEHGLYVILRIGPYICAEINYGGFPSWLREVPDIQMRTYNEPFMREMADWVRHLANYMQSMFAPQGGPIILVQIENEYGLIEKNYGEDGKRYMQWAIDLGHSLNLGIPWIMCVGSGKGAIETMNGFYGYRMLDEYRRRHPDQPGIWTENWPGWYDTYGYPHHIRTPEDVAYAVARYFAAGGTGVNYYMWHGGTNFGREPMYLQTTSYDYTAPLDEFGLPTTKYYHLARLHEIINEHANLLLQNERANPQMLGAQQPVYVYGNSDDALIFICNDAIDSVEVSYNEQSYTLPPQSVILISRGEVLMNTAEVRQASMVQHIMHPLTGELAPFTHRSEPFPNQWPEAMRSGIVRDTPVEQLQFTHDETDYCWYSTKLKIDGDRASQGRLTLHGIADVVHVFVDGQFVGTTPGPLKENRGRFDGPDFVQTIPMSFQPGEHELSLFCCAIGLIKGDWMIGNLNMAEERKGIWGAVTWNEQPLDGPWSIQPGLVGERTAIYGEAGNLLEWKTDVKAATNCPLAWLRTTFDMPDTDEPLALDLSSMQKGMAWLNGRCIGRYWLAPGIGKSEAWLSPPIEDVRAGAPTQCYYHLPAEWLKEKNVLVLFEEIGGDPTAICLNRWR